MSITSMKTTYSTFTTEPNHDFIDEELSDMSLTESLETIEESLRLTAEEILLSLGFSSSDSNEPLDIVYSILWRLVNQSDSNLAAQQFELSPSVIGFVPDGMANGNDPSLVPKLDSRLAHSANSEAGVGADIDLETKC